ncbi:MAG: peptidylprolyl isomerase [Deltaproteobacteria bacterium]
MKRNAVIVGAAVIVSLALYGCDNIPWPGIKKPAPKEEKTQAVPEVKGTLIAKVNNIPVTLEELNQEVEAFNSMVPEDKPEAKVTTKEKKIDYLKNEIVRRILLYQLALDKGLDKKDEVQRALDKTKQDLMVMALVRDEAAKVEVSSAEIEDYYNKFKEQLKEPEERRIREIVLPTEAEAKDVLVQLLQGADFAELARQRSKSSSADNGGDLGFIAKGKKSTQFDAVAFSDALEVGQYSNFFRAPDGYYIIKLEAKRGGKQKSLSEMWDDIKRGLTFLKQQQRIEELIGNLSRDAKIEVYEGAIK